VEQVLSYKLPFQSQITWVSQHSQWGLGEGGGEEFRLQSREGQELSAATDACQLIRKMSCEDQTVDPRNKLMGNDHGTIFVRFRGAWRTGRHKLCK
jgi:hypothetical protein